MEVYSLSDRLWVGTHLVIYALHILDLLLTDIIGIQLEPVNRPSFPTIHIVPGARFIAGTFSKLLA